jgi:uncharacterized LabA/DUF88 family protein
VTYVYVDGFNLYYGALKRTPHRWLDIGAFCDLLLPKNDVRKVRYFTARVRPLPNKPGCDVRQQAYLRALATLPRVELHFGHFLSHPISLPLCTSDGTILMAGGKPRYATVLKAEEKGSDVNLAAHLLDDAHRGAFQVAVVISNDSDLAAPIELVTRDLRLPVGVVNPHAENPRSRHSVQLRQVASFLKPVRQAALRKCQLPPVLHDAAGTFHKPPTW